MFGRLFRLFVMRSFSNGQESRSADGRKEFVVNLRLFLTVMAFIFIGIAGPKIGEQVTERRLIKIVKRLQTVQEMEILRCKIANEAHVEYIKMLEERK